MKIELRDPNIVMKLSKLGSFHQSKLSFLRSFLKEFKLLLKARYSLLYISTKEEERLEYAIRSCIQLYSNRSLYSWDFVDGYTGNPNDNGFALKDWVKVESFPETWVLLGDTAFSQGKVKLTNKDGNVTIVDKTWGYKKKSDGSTCIMLHHSSLPYEPPTSN